MYRTAQASNFGHVHEVRDKGWTKILIDYSILTRLQIMQWMIPLPKSARHNGPWKDWKIRHLGGCSYYKICIATILFSMAHRLTVGWCPANIQRGGLIWKLADSEEHIFMRLVIPTRLSTTTICGGKSPLLSGTIPASLGLCLPLNLQRWPGTWGQI